MNVYSAEAILTEDGILRNAYLCVEQGKVVAIKVKTPSDAWPTDMTDQVINYQGRILAPGLIDVHTHGAFGYETGSGTAEQLQAWARFQFAQGVTGFLPTTVSLPFNKLEEAVQEVRLVMERPNSNILGLQLEGPFFTPGTKRGAQDPRYFCSDFPVTYQNFLREHSKVIRSIAVDPCHPETRKILTFCRCHGIKVSAGHSEISYEDFSAQQTLGYECITHTFNGMGGLDHRCPGLALAACIDDNLYAEIICDGFHVAYPMLHLFFKLKGFERVILITDSMAATGMPSGDYRLGEIDVWVGADGRVTKEDGGLAGSTLTMVQAVRNLVMELEVPLAKAVQMGSLNPARFLEIDRAKGSLAPGKDADFVVLNHNLEVEATYLQGVQVFTAHPQETEVSR